MASSKVPPGDSDAFLAMMRTQSCPVGADYVSWLNGLCVGWQERRAAAGLAVPPPAPTPAPEVCCASPLCPHSSPGGGTSQVGGAAERDAGIVTPASSTPAPEAKRPTHVRITGPKGQLSVTIGKVYEVLYFDDDRARLIIKNDDGVEWGLSNKPDEGPAFPTWAPAPCPPPVAGRGEDDMRSAAQALLDALGDILLVQPESSPIRDKVRALRASIARTVRS